MPSSAAVSDTPEALPARSGGAEPTIRSVHRAVTTLTEKATSAKPAISGATSPSRAVAATTAKPRSPTVSPAATTVAGCARRTDQGATTEPTRPSATAGSVARPASSTPSP
jgi:hypothetical protein